VAARAQQGERARCVGVLMAATADDPEFQPRMACFQQGLAALGWIDGRNVLIDTRWATTNADDIRRHAAELAALAPDVILAGTGTTTVAPLLQATRTVPIVFVVVIDPGNRSRCQHSLRDCAVRRHPVRRALARDGGESGQRHAKANRGKITFVSSGRYMRHFNSGQVLE
jgi:hypothetical protein